MLQADINKVQMHPRECLRGGMLRLMSRKPEQPKAKATEVVLNVDAQLPRGAPTETGSIDPPSDVLKISGDAAEPPAALDLVLLVQRRVRGFLARGRVKRVLRRDCALPDIKIAAVTLTATMGTSPYQASRCCPVPPAAARAMRKLRSRSCPHRPQRCARVLVTRSRARTGFCERAPPAPTHDEGRRRREPGILLYASLRVWEGCRQV